MPSHPFGLVGLGGFAAGVCESLLTRPHKRPFQLTHIFDPEPDRFPGLVKRLKARYVTMCRTYEELLNSQVAAVWLPIPIDHHRIYTEAALHAGKPVLCEKPAAGSIQEVDGMIKLRDESRCPVAIGFQDIYADSTRELKQILLRGELGTIQSATLLACWPRNAEYYSRSWTGQVQRNGKWLLDSPANNALAHAVHMALFLMGPSLFCSAEPVAVEAELYRANPIPNYDTCSLRVTLANSASLLIHLTHASADFINPVITLHGANGSVHYDYGKKKATIGEQTLTLTDLSHEQTLCGFESLLYEPGSTHLHASLEMSRCHAAVVSGASQVAPVQDIPNSMVATRPQDRAPLRFVPGIEDVFRTLTARHQMLHESGLVPWSTPARKISLTNYKIFSGPALPETLASTR